jgi:uncharacterized membrane protein YebE (DUF533 family)
MAKGKKGKKLMKKVLIGAGVIAAAVVGFVLYKRSKQPGLSTQA